ncbi:zinc finger, CCHC-type containing protein [Tanacetum coccineum]
MNFLHVPNIRKNLVFGFKLCKSGVKAVIESEKVIFSKANVFVGKAYACDGMFKLNINKITSSAYLPDCNFISSFNIECSAFNLWHNRLVHINYRTMNDMLKQGIISYNGEHKDKCKICVQAKMKRKPFPKVDRQSENLELVYSDICELNGQLTRGGNSAPRRSERARKERNLDPDFIDSQAIIFLVEDDILIVGTNMEGINETKKFMSSCFQMKDMNEIDTILGIKVKRHSRGYALNQYHYIDKIIDKFKHLNIKKANTPYESSCKLVENNRRVVAQIEYASAICCLMYVTHCTRPDIAYVICKLSRYTSNPSQDHWKAIGRVFVYL